MTSEDAEVGAHLNRLRAAYRDAEKAAAEAPDPHRGFELATAIAEELRRLVGKAADGRARAAKRIWQHESLSLAGLAKRIGVSKPRAGQFIATATTAEQDERTRNVRNDDSHS